MPVAIKECQRCGGQILNEYGEEHCLQCEAEHDREGNLIPHPIGFEDLRFAPRSGHHLQRKVENDN